MTARLWFILAALFMAGCGASTSILPEPFTRERADGKIPVKTELIRQQVQRELGGMPEGEAEVARWQAIEADYHSCRLSSKKAAQAAEEVFADCMANRGYVYMYPLDAEQLHNDIAFEMKKNPDKWQNQIVTATIAASPITITNTPLPTISTASDSGGYATYLLGIAAIGGIAVAVGGGGGGGGDGGGGGNSPSITPTPTMTMTMTPPPTPTPTTSTRYEITSPELGAWHIEQTMSNVIRNPNGTLETVNGSWLIIIPVSEQGLNYNTGVTNGNHNVLIQRQRVTHVDWNGRSEWPARVDRNEWNSLGEGRWHDVNYWLSATIFFPGNTRDGFDNFLSFASIHEWQILFATRPDIRGLSDLCPARWLGDYLNNNYPPNDTGRFMCSYPVGTSYSPDMQQVIYAAMVDGFNPGVAIGESGFAFSGRYDNNNRAAGFAYDLGGYSLRTDYTRLPSKQDNEVWLDTYRLGALTRINDEVQLYAGVDSYRNAIIAIDNNGNNMHRLGFAIGNGYAVKYEFRLDL